jgi:hypothetical protein
MRLLRVAIALAGVVAMAAQGAGRDLTPTGDAQVVQTLGPRTLAVVPASAAATPQAAAQAAQRAAQQAITQARETADPRYLGRAQGVLAPWWDKPDAPAALAVLQATVQQGRHEFAAARATLESALKRDPSQAQGWLTLATLERVAGRYAQALVACRQVASAGAALYAAACELETTSLQGRHDEARRGLQALALQAPDPSTRAWLTSLLAESEERAGRDAPALTAYQASLALAPDGYTALAAADLMLRTGKAAAALKLLDGQPASDAVLLRRARALKAMNDPRWQALATELRERFAALDARGDDPATHARERAMAALWLQGDGAVALAAAQLNLTLQREPLDWWLALRSAELAQQPGELARLKDALAATGLRDARLVRHE